MQAGGRSILVGILTTAALMVWAPAASGAAELEYVTSAEKKLKAGGVAFKKANCPNDTQVIGGGVVIIGGNTATAVRSSFPVDDNDGNQRPEDAWLGAAISRSAGDKQIVTIAICSRGVQLNYFAEELLMGSSQTTLYSECPIGTRLAGGGIELAAGDGAMNNGLVAAATVPYDSVGGARPEAWLAIGTNSTMFFAGIRSYAICANGGSYEYVERQEMASVGSQAGVAAPCPNGTRVTAGGGDVGSNDDSAELARAAPYRDGGRLPDDGWQGTVNNNTVGGDINFSTWAVCRG